MRDCDLTVDDDLISAVAARCRDLREQRHLSLQEAGDRAGYTKSHMWEFEQGRSTNPTIRLLLGLARAYGVSMHYLLGADTKQPPLDPEALRIAADIDRMLRKARA